MNSFLYFLAGLSGKPTAEQAAELRIGHAWGPHMTYLPCDGPGGVAGVVVGHKAMAPLGLGYHPKTQTWIPMRTGAANPPLVGWSTANPPGPADLERDRQLAGHAVRLADGRRWLCPAARRFHETAANDHGFEFVAGVPLHVPTRRGPDGKWQPGEASVRPEYVDLWERAEAFAAQWFAEFVRADAEESESVMLDLDALMQGAIAALQINYRIGPDEVEALDLVGQQEAIDVMKALIDWPTFATWLQKKTADLDSGCILNGVGG